MKWLGDIKAVWMVVVGTAMGVLYMFNTFASAADVEEIKEEVKSIEVRLIKADIREIRRELKLNHMEQDLRAFLQDELAEAIIDLCIKQPNDKECR